MSDSIDVAAIRAAHEALQKADCVGPITTFPQGPDKHFAAQVALVQIPCVDYVALIQWMACVNRNLPDLLDAIESARKDVVSLRTEGDTIAAYANKLQDNLTAQLSTARAEAEQLRSERDSLRAQVDDFSEHHASMVERTLAAQAESAQLRAERDSFMQQAIGMTARFAEVRAERDAAIGKYEQCKEAHAALIQTHMRVMDDKNALVLEVKQWRTTKGDASK